MTPQEIQEKHFHDTFRGYSHEEVDLFLDEVAVAFERLYRENQSFMRRVVDLEEQLKRAQEEAGSQPARVGQETYEEDQGVTESTLKRMLLIAQETADRAVQEARQRAREIQEQARARADEMMEHAERRVRELSSQRMEKEKELERAKEALRRFDQQYRESFRVFIESQLEALKDLPASPSPVQLEASASQTFGPAADPLGGYEAPVDPLGGYEAPVDPLGGYEPDPAAPAIGMETVAMAVEPVEPQTSPDPETLEQGNSVDLDPPAAEHASSQTHEAAPQWEEEPAGSFESPDDPELVRTGRHSTSPGTSPPSQKDEDQEEGGTSRSTRNRSRTDRKAQKDAAPTDGKDAEEDRLIRELFWGDDE